MVLKQNFTLEEIAWEFERGKSFLARIKSREDYFAEQNSIGRVVNVYDNCVHSLDPLEDSDDKQDLFGMPCTCPNHHIYINWNNSDNPRKYLERDLLYYQIEIFRETPLNNPNQLSLQLN